MANPGESSTTTQTTTILPQHATLGQLSYGPATQQTVTTVTTTTTIALPPLIMKPPKDLFDRDPKQYPLAFSPTPPSLKRFAFDLDGRPTTFHEVEDPVDTMRRFHKMQARMQKSNGVLRREDVRECQTPIRDVRPTTRQGRAGENLRISAASKRAAGPPSIADAAELASLQRKSKKPRAHLHRTQSEQVEHPSLNQRTAAGAFSALGNLIPITPDVDVASQNLASGLEAGYSRRRKSPMRASQSRLQQLQDTDDEEQMFADGPSDAAEKERDGLLGTPLYGRRDRKRKVHTDRPASVEPKPDAVTATPPIAADEFPVPTQTPHEYRRPALPNIITLPPQDASLPSPSLSPITAAANLMSRSQNVFEASFGDQNGGSPSTLSGGDCEEDTRFIGAKSTDSQETLSANEQMRAPLGLDNLQPGSSAAQPTVMDIPTMVDAFDSMPEAMQTYLIYQFLRRCTKPTLQVVANVVNPALKCDPFNILPPELSLNITHFLDAQSMCRAAQVSKKWRKLISSDERAWKDLLDRDEFVLPKDEIARAVREGWGWQHPGEDGFERDLNREIPPQSPERATASSDTLSNMMSEDDDVTSSTITSRTRRRSTLRSTNAKKGKRRGGASSSALITRSSLSLPSGPAPWRRLLASAQGPIALANAAAQAMPHPTVGLSSLKNMHLFKSLYQRHYLVRRAWMHDEPHSQPLHLAFRAHHRHVVTCLLFDSDKILTGSDDTKINVYDTKTGALRNRLEGHEGGVWALQYEGDTLVSGSTDRSVRVWDIKTGRCLQVFQGHTSTVRCLVILQPVQIGTESDGTPIIMPKEPLIITGSRDSTLRVWKLPKPDDPQIFQTVPPANDRDNPYFLRTLAGHHNSVRAIAAHGDTLISGSYDCSVRVWKISTGDLIHRLQGHGQKVYSVVLDHARNRCISGSMDHLVKVWDLQTGTCLYNLEGHTSLVGLLDLSHDRLVSAAADSTLRIWDPETGTCKATLSAHTGAITCFQHDGQKVISGSDRTLKMWNVKNGECVRDLLTDLSGVWQVRFDQRRCVAAVQRNSLTYIEVLDFGAARDGVPADRRGRRVVVDCRGREIEDVEMTGTVLDPEIAVGVEV